MERIDDLSIGNENKLKKQSTKRTMFEVAWLSFSSLGAIYGDIGTSPLYVLNTVFTDETVTPKRAMGAMSCVFWIFTLVVIVKYCLLVLSLGPNNGEGGQVAIYCKLSRVLMTGPKDVKLPGSKERDDFQLLTRSETTDSGISRGTNFDDEHSLLSNKKFRKVFSVATMCACFLGCSLVISDGLLTPTTSVLSAVDGIAVAIPSFSGKVMPVAVGILLVLFFIQPFGSQLISMTFSPIITLWFITIFIKGVINIIPHPEVFGTLNPKYAIDFLREQGGIDVLGPFMLCITGCEAMFADVGHFSPLSVQLTLGCFVYPCLMLEYLGQTSYLLDHPEAVANVFFNSVPGRVSGALYWYVFVVSTLATVIASQALILGCFSIVNQMIQIDCFPRLKVVHKSAKHHGQIFIPAVNFILMVAVICTCVGFKTSSNVTAAYGLGVSMDLLITSSFLAAAMIINFKLHFTVALFYFATFGALEMCFVIANLKKVPHGAWFTLMVTGIMFFSISLWRWGVSTKHSGERQRRVRLKDMLYEYSDVSGSFVLGAKSAPIGGSKPSPSLFVKLHDETPFEITRHQDIAFMYTEPSLLLDSPNNVPEEFKDILTNFPSLPSLFVFVGIKVATAPYVDEEERILVQPMRGVNGLYRCIVRYGFMDTMEINGYVVESILSRIQDMDPEYFESMVHFRNRTPLSIFGRAHLSGAKKYRIINLKQDLFSYTPIGFVFESFRAFFIEKVFAPIYSIQAIPSSIVSYNDPQNKRVIYIGNEVEI